MGRQLSSESMEMLRKDASRAIDLAALSEWLVQVEYDEDVSREERNALARIRLTAIEATEGLRPEADVYKDVSALLRAAATGAHRQTA